MKRIMKMSMLWVVFLGMCANIGFAAEKKTILVHRVAVTEPFAEKAIETLANAGFVDQQNVEIVRIPLADADDPVKLAAIVQETSPAVLMNFVASKPILDVLESLSIPVVMHLAIEQFVDAEGMPKTANVTGHYSTLYDMFYGSYKFLQKVAPLKPGQKVVYLENRIIPFLPTEPVKEALQRLQIPLKAVVDTSYYEDWQQAILKYNDDPEVGWILMGVPANQDRDGTLRNLVDEAIPWMREHLKKPTSVHADFLVQAGAPFGFSIDYNELGVQVGEKTIRVLQGEDVHTIKAEYPRKVLISLNRKTATNMGIVFPLDVLDLAQIIYDDYEGKQVIRK